MTRNYAQALDRNNTKMMQAQALGHILIRPEPTNAGYAWACECGYPKKVTQSLNQARNNYQRHALRSLAKAKT